MRLEQLEYLAAVTRHSSLRRASAELHVSQSALSEALSKLERELGVQLLVRDRSGVRISPAGQELLPSINDVLESVGRLRSSAGDELAAGRVVRLGTVSTGTSAVVLPAIRDFQLSDVGHSIEVRTLQRADVVSGLTGGALDLGLVNGLDREDPLPDMTVIPLLRGRPVVVLPADHRLAELETVTVDDLRIERFVGLRPGYLMHRFAQRLFGGEPPAHRHAADGAEMTKLMVAAGIGVAVLPDFSVYDDPLVEAGLISTRRLSGNRTRVHMQALHLARNRLPAGVSELLAHLIARARDRRPYRWAGISVSATTPAKGDAPASTPNARA